MRVLECFKGRPGKSDELWVDVWVAAVDTGEEGMVATAEEMLAEAEADGPASVVALPPVHSARPVPQQHSRWNVVRVPHRLRDDKHRLAAHLAPMHHLLTRICAVPTSGAG